MESSNRRADYRVAVPASLVRELAVWFCPQKDYIRLEAGQLGKPNLILSKLDEGAITLTDLSIRGLGMLLIPPAGFSSEQLSSGACFTYLQLWNPSADDPYGVLSVFTYNNLVRVAPKEQALFLGGRFVRFAVGSKYEKSLEFLDAQACGVTALARWCDNVARGIHVEPGHQNVGLDMDNLLAEIDSAMAGSPEPGEEGR